MGGTYNGVHVDNNLFDVTGGTLTVSAPLINRYNNGSAGFVKAGVGTMVLAADNRFNGAVTVSNGLLQVGDGGAAGTLGTGVSAVNLVNDDVTLLVNRSGFLGHSGAISGDGSLVKDGESVLTLSGANSYTGNTVISNGVLAVTIEDALPGYAAAGRVLLEPGAALSVGVGSWTTDAINTLLATGIYGPETGFGFDTTAGNYTYNGQFTLPTVARLVKTGPNALTITGGNTCPGSVLALGGILQGDFGAGLPAATNVTLGNATLSSVSGVLTPSLGEGAGQVTIMAGFPAGFSAVDVPLTVNVGGAGETLSWGTTEFNPSALVLNGLGANTNLTLVNGINLNGATRVVNVDASGAGAEAEITGVIANGSGVAGLVKGGAGTLRLTVPSTYTGGTTVDAGTLELIGGNNHLDTGADITVNAATLDLGGNTQALTAGTFTLGDGAVLRNGTFNYRDTSWSPKFGASVSFGTGGSFTTPHRLLLKDAQALTLTADAGTSVFGGDGANSCNFVGVDDARSNTVTVAGGSLNFTNMASGAGFMRLGANGTATTKPIGVLNVSGGEVNVGHAMGLGTRHDNRLAAAYGEGVLNLSGGSVNVGTGSSTATGNGRLGWLYLGNGHGSTASKSTLNLNGGTLSVVQIEAGASGVNTLHLNGGTLRARADNATFLNGANLMAHVYERGLTLDTADYDVGVGVNLSGAGTLTKTGAGTLMLSGGNTYSGVTTVEEGTLKLSPLGGANLVLHLDASDVSTLFQNADGSDAVTTSGQPVGYWGDLSDSGKPATQAITVRRPIYVTNVAEFNNKAVIEFDGTDDSLTSLLNINPDSLPNMTIVIVYKQLPENGNGGLWGHDNGYWDRLQLFYNVGTYYQVATSNAAVSVKGMETNVVTVYSAVLRNDVPGGSYVYINGISDATTGLPAFTSVDSGGTPDLTLGSIGAGNTGYAGRCQIAEVLVFDTALSDTARRNVEVRLRNKWLGASDPVTPVLQSGTSVQLMAETQPNLKLHLDASVRSSLFTDAAGVGAVTESGHPVGYWSDLSGNAKPATQATLSRRPTYVTAARGFCGLPAVEFDGADDSLTSLLNINADEMPNMTIVIAYKQLPESGNGGLWGHDNGGWDRLQLFRNGNIYYQIATANAAESVKGMEVDVVTVYSAVLRNGVPGGSYVYINGVSDATTGLPAFTSVDSGGSADLTLGSIGTGNVNYAGRCQIGEVLVFDTALDNMARQNVEAYLRDKWQNGIPGRIELAAGAVLDLDGAVQEVTAISGGGTVSNGTLSVTELLSPAGTAVGTLGVADVTLSGVLRVNVTPAGTCDRLVGSGDLSLTGLTLQIAKLELLNPEMTYTVATCTGTLTGPFAETNLPANWRVRYDVGAGTAVFYYAEPGTLFQMK
jgi:autotransporter-associated beta strand protein